MYLYCASGCNLRPPQCLFEANLPKFFHSMLEEEKRLFLASLKDQEMWATFV